MQLENLEEYKLLRLEVETIKNCITQYVGFVFGGSGLAVIVVPFFVRLLSAQAVDTIVSNYKSSIAFTAAFLSALVALITLILFYKFNSHNRYCGYFKLLTTEHWGNEYRLNEPAERFEPIIGWEWCLDRLREAEINPNYRSETLAIVESLEKADDSMKGIKGRLEKTYGSMRDRGDGRKGLMMLIKSIFGKGNTRSWAFPYPITVVLFLISSIFAVSSILTAVAGLVYLDDRKVVIVELAGGGVDPTDWIIILMVGIILAFWWSIFKRLFRLMDDEGDRTIEAYCIRFLPIREEFLKRHGISCNWGRLFQK